MSQKNMIEQSRECATEQCGPMRSLCVPIHEMMPSQYLLHRMAPPQTVRGCSALRVHQTGAIFSLWRAWEEECDRETPVPFWAVVWPAAAVLAHYVLKERGLVAGKTVLEVGCGGGAAALAAAMAGAAKVIANDVDPIATRIAEHNAQANGIHLDFSNRDFTCGEIPAGVDVVLVADLFYERTVSHRLLRALRAARQRGVRVLVADGQRPFAPVPTGEPLWVRKAPTDRELEGVAERTVRIFEYNP
ncbi:MAG: methyltransferase domain-containing protein [Chitinivibrionales bacterium]|nr:methyltransferase domain-containing protein [Chitinivibrionales bacterium]MBD3355931.1 methyltransferase domain-containing protein [Chitinivibrionales bacterium]